MLNNDAILSPNLERYYNLMARYRNGEFGNKFLSLAEILEAANESELLSQMSLDEIQYLIDHSFGMTRMMFSELKRQKLDSQEQSESSSLFLTKRRKKQ